MAKFALQMSVMASGIFKVASLISLLASSFVLFNKLYTTCVRVPIVKTIYKHLGTQYCNSN